MTGDDFDFFPRPAPPPPAPAPAPAPGEPPHDSGFSGVMPGGTGHGGAQLTSAEYAHMWSTNPDSMAKLSAPRFPTSGRLGFRRSLEAGLYLSRTCGQVLLRDPALVVAPIINLVAGAGCAYAYVSALGGIESLFAGGRLAVAVRTFPLIALLSILGVLAGATVVTAATARLQGGALRLGAAWGRVLLRLPQLVLFAIVWAAERTLTGMLRSRRGGGLGNLTANMIDRAWDFATFMAIPVLMFEDGVGPLQAVKRSASLVRKRWGPQLTANGVISIALFVLMLPLIIIGVILCGTSMVLGVTVIVLSLLAEVIVAATLSAILSAAMYRFATTGLVAPGFTETDMWASFTGV